MPEKRQTFLYYRGLVKELSVRSDMKDLEIGLNMTEAEFLDNIATFPPVKLVDRATKVTVYVSYSARNINMPAVVISPKNSKYFRTFEKALDMALFTVRNEARHEALKMDAKGKRQTVKSTKLETRRAALDFLLEPMNLSTQVKDGDQLVVDLGDREIGLDSLKPIDNGPAYVVIKGLGPMSPGKALQILKILKEAT